MLLKILSAALMLFAASSILVAQITDQSEMEMTRPHEPFRVIANIYYVGTNDVTSFLITSDEGHILIDSGFEETVAIIEENIRKLGFELKDVRILLNNHAHYDHCGGLATLKEKTGAKLFAVEQQAELLASGGSSDFRFGGKQIFRPVKADKILGDGETVALGGNELLTHLTPGHTKGSTTWTIKVKEDDKILTVIFLSSLSTLDYDLVGNDAYPDHAAQFRSTFSRLLALRPDVFLGSHAGFFSMERKFRKMKDGARANPFVDPDGYGSFVRRMKLDFEERLSEQERKKVSGTNR